MRRKTILWIFQASNRLNLTRKDSDMAAKRKPYERN